MTSPPKGLLDPRAAAERLRLARVLPSEALADFVEHHWIVEWNLPPGESHEQRTLPYPCVHVAFEREKTAVFGVMRGRFGHRLEGRGRVLGASAFIRARSASCSAAPSHN